MATVVLGIAGAVAGSVVPGLGWELGWTIGTSIGGIIDNLNHPGVKQDIGKLTDLKVTTSSYGTAIPITWGDNKIGGSVIWSTDLQEHKQSVGGGKGGGGQKQTQYSYSVSVAVLINKVGHNQVLKRIWGDDEVIWDAGDVQNNAKRFFVNNNATSSVRFYNGSEMQGVDSLLQAAHSNTPAYRGSAYVVLEGLWLTDFGNRLPNMMFEVDSDPCTVGNIIQDVAGLTGLNAPLGAVDRVPPVTGGLNDLDTSAATTPVQGYNLTSRVAGHDAIQTPLQTYLFDLIEADGVLRAVPRGLPVAGVIDPGDLGAMEYPEGGGGDPAERVDETRAQEIELPSTVEVGYFSRTQNFEQQIQRANRESAPNINVVTLNLNLTMGDDDAMQVAARYLYTAWLERSSFQVSLPPRYIVYTPADCLLFNVGGYLRRCRLISMEAGLPGQIVCSLLLDEATALTQAQFSGGTGAGGDTGGGYVPTVPPVVPTNFVAWSGTEIRDSDQSNAGFYVAGTGAKGWTAAAIFYSFDNGATYAQVGSLIGKSVIGTMTSTLADVTAETLDANGFDTATASVTLLQDGALESVSGEASVMNGQNVARIGSEIVGFVNANLTGAEAYNLVDLWRAVRKSPGTGHVASEPFVLLDSTVQRVSVAPSLVGQTVLVKCVSVGQQLSDVTAVPVTIATPTPSANDTAIGGLQNQVNAIVGTPGPAWGIVGNDVNQGGSTAFNPEGITPTWADVWHSKDGNLSFGNNSSLGNFEPIVYQQQAILRTRLLNKGTTAKTISLKVEADNAARVFLTPTGGARQNPTGAATSGRTYSSTAKPPTGSIYDTAKQPTGALAVWPLNEGAGATSGVDPVGGWNVTLQNAATYTANGITTPLGGAFKATPPAGTGVPDLSNFSFMVNINPTSNNSEGAGEIATQSGFWYCRYDGLYFNILYFSGSSIRALSLPASAVPLNQYTRIVFVVENGDLRSLYLNGVKQGVGPSNYASGVTRDNTTAKNVITFFDQGDGTSNERISGTITDAALYSRALTDAEVSTICNAPFQNFYSGATPSTDTNLYTGPQIYNVNLQPGDNLLEICYQNSDGMSGLLNVEGWDGTKQVGLATLVDNMAATLPISSGGSGGVTGGTAEGQVPYWDTATNAGAGGILFNNSLVSDGNGNLSLTSSSGASTSLVVNSTNGAGGLYQYATKDGVNDLTLLQTSGTFRIYIAAGYIFGIDPDGTTHMAGGTEVQSNGNVNVSLDLYAGRHIYAQTVTLSTGGDSYQYSNFVLGKGTGPQLWFFSYRQDTPEHFAFYYFDGTNFNRNVDLDPNGTMTLRAGLSAGGGVSAPTLAATGNITAGGSVSAVTLAASGSVTAGGSVAAIGQVSGASVRGAHISGDNTAGVTGTDTVGTQYKDGIAVLVGTTPLPTYAAPIVADSIASQQVISQSPNLVTFSAVNTTHVPPATEGDSWEWQTSTNNGSTWGSSTYAGDAFSTTLATGTVMARARLNGQNGTVTAWVQSANVTYVQPPPRALEIYIPGTLATGADTLEIPMPTDFAAKPMKSVSARLRTASTSGAVSFNIQQATATGAFTVAATSDTFSVAVSANDLAPVTSFTTNLSLNAGNKIRLNLTAAGTGASDLTVKIEF